MRAIWNLLGAGFALACASCSLIFVTPPPENVATLPPMAQVECTTSRVAPILDGIGGTYQLVRTAVAVSNDDAAYEGQPISRGADIGIGVGLSALFIVSTVYGFKQTGKCRKAKAMHLEKQRIASEPQARRSPDEQGPGALARPGVAGIPVFTW